MINLMIVDDEELIREEIKSKIIRIDNPNINSILLAADGAEAKHVLQQCNPEIVISDIRMPNIDGLTFIRDSSQSNPNTKFIVLSGHDDYGYVREAFKCGIVDYLLKPVRLIELEKQLNRAIEQYLDDMSRDERSISKIEITKENTSDNTEIKNVSHNFFRSSYESNTINGHIASSSRTLIGMVKQYVEERPLGEVTLAEVSNLVSMNYSYFSTWFKEETGQTFSAYVMKLRMEQAKRLLEDPTIRISEIAVQVGYDNIYHFSRAFKNFAGLSPKEYRKCIEQI